MRIIYSNQLRVCVRKLLFFLIFFYFSHLSAEMTESLALRRIHDHLLVKDINAAFEEGKKSIELFPTSKDLRLAYLKVLCEKGEERLAFDELKNLLPTHETDEWKRNLFESLAWGVLTKGESSSLIMIRLYSLLGAAFTRDAKAVSILLKELRSSNALLRSLAVKISSSYGDSPLQDELLSLLKSEKVWYVRHEVIQSIGRLGIIKALPMLKDIVANPKTLAEEKALALVALVSMYDQIEEKDLTILIQSERAGLRELACDLVAHLEKNEYLSTILPLLKDPSPHVRMACLNTFGLLGVKEVNQKNILPEILKITTDSSPEVAITAAWLATIFDDSKGKEVLRSWIQQENVDWKRMASAALAAAGSHGVDLSLSLIQSEIDPFTRVNLLVGLIGQRKSIQTATNDLFQILSDSKIGLCMWDSSHNPLFRSLAPSKVRHIEQIPRYPQVVDHHVKLELLSVLSILRHPQAIQLIKNYLNEPAWGITSAAVMTLLQEGDDLSLDQVRDLLDDPNEKIRIQAALILAIAGNDTAAVQSLQKEFIFADREIKMNIMEAIGQIGDPSSIPFLVEVLQDPFQVLRVIAASCLIQCIYH
ncbi:MAG: hypothetical protein EBZ47_01175 [Chlamydiae bacterium]|nr:hypothetical protein [Chlamydiota bacterium]